MEKKLSEKGKILTYTVIYVGPEGFETPYCIGIIELDEGVMISGQIVGNLELIDTDKEVQMVFRKIYETEDGLINYGFKFEIIE